VEPTDATTLATAAPMKVPATPKAPDNTAAVTAASALATTCSRLGRMTTLGGIGAGSETRTGSGVGSGWCAFWGAGTAVMPGFVAGDGDIVVDIAGLITSCEAADGRSSATP
jgi:hypothetical protein